MSATQLAGVIAIVAVAGLLALGAAAIVFFRGKGGAPTVAAGFAVGLMSVGVLAGGLVTVHVINRPPSPPSNVCAVGTYNVTPSGTARCVPYP